MPATQADSKKRKRTFTPPADAEPESDSDESTDDAPAKPDEPKKGEEPDFDTWMESEDW